jgi:hypothetical protein
MRIANARLTEAWTISGARTFGRMWRNTMRGQPAPRPRAAATWSFSRSAITGPRATRLKSGA